jgi:hypothetical protein
LILAAEKDSAVFLHRQEICPTVFIPARENGPLAL